MVGGSSSCTTKLPPLEPWAGFWTDSILKCWVIVDPVPSPNFHLVWHMWREEFHHGVMYVWQVKTFLPNNVVDQGLLFKLLNNYEDWSHSIKRRDSIHNIYIMHSIFLHWKEEYRRSSLVCIFYHLFFPPHRLKSDCFSSSLVRELRLTQLAQSLKYFVAQFSVSHTTIS